MRKGMRKLLEIHKPEELSILCKMFDIKGRMTKNQKIEKIYVQELQGGIPSYRNVLGFVWDGILIEYLRTIGRKVRNHKTDLRLIIWKYWLRGSDPKTDGWTRVYIPQTAGLKEIERTNDASILDYLKRIKREENALKSAETEMRVLKNYVGAMKMFDCIAKLRRTEEQCRKSIIADLEGARSQLYLMSIRESALKRALQHSEKQRELFEEKAVREIAERESALTLMTEEVANQSMIISYLKTDCVSMLETAHRQRKETAIMNDDMEHALMSLSLAESRLEKALEDEERAKSKARKMKNLLHDSYRALDRLWDKYIFAKQRKKNLSTSLCGLVMESQNEKNKTVAKLQRELQEEKNRGQMTYEELTQRRNAILHPPRKKKKGKGGKKKKKDGKGGDGGDKKKGKDKMKKAVKKAKILKKMRR
eukprot:g2592.t1